MNHKRRIKIVATFGPSSSEDAMVQRLHEAGADVFRINMSHAGHELMQELVRRIRRVEGLAGQSASWPTCKGRSCASAPSKGAKSSSRQVTRSRLTTLPCPATIPVFTYRIPR